MVSSLRNIARSCLCVCVIFVALFCSNYLYYQFKLQSTTHANASEYAVTYNAVLHHIRRYVHSIFTFCLFLTISMRILLAFNFDVIFSFRHYLHSLHLVYFSLVLAYGTLSVLLLHTAPTSDAEARESVQECVWLILTAVLSLHNIIPRRVWLARQSRVQDEICDIQQEQHLMRTLCGLLALSVCCFLLTFAYRINVYQQCCMYLIGCLICGGNILFTRMLAMFVVMCFSYWLDANWTREDNIDLDVTIYCIVAINIFKSLITIHAKQRHINQQCCMLSVMLNLFCFSYINWRQSHLSQPMLEYYYLARHDLLALNNHHNVLTVLVLQVAQCVFSVIFMYVELRTYARKTRQSQREQAWTEYATPTMVKSKQSELMFPQKMSAIKSTAIKQSVLLLNLKFVALCTQHLAALKLSPQHENIIIMYHLLIYKAVHTLGELLSEFISIGAD